MKGKASLPREEALAFRAACTSDGTVATVPGAVCAGDSATTTEVSLAMDAFFERVDAEPLAKERLAAAIAWCKSNAIV